MREFPSIAVARGFAAALVLVSVLTSRAYAVELGCAANGHTPEFEKNYGGQLDKNQAWLVIEGDPIMYAAGSLGDVAAWVCQPGGVIRQYYSDDSFGSTLWTDGTPLFKSPFAINNPPNRGGGPVSWALISHQKPDDWTIETVWASETGLELRQTISYSPGDLYVKKRWELIKQPVFCKFRDPLRG